MNNNLDMLTNEELLELYTKLEEVLKFLNDSIIKENEDE
jgi:hypothetical protein